MSDWLEPSSLLNFSSELEPAITVSTQGVLSLWSNWYESIQLSAFDICGEGFSGTLDVYANLEPEAYDVDLGSETGAAFGTVSVGDSFDVEVRVQGSGNLDLTAFQVIIEFNSSLVIVSTAKSRGRSSDSSSTMMAPAESRKLCAEPMSCLTCSRGG